MMYSLILTIVTFVATAAVVLIVRFMVDLEDRHPLIARAVGSAALFAVVWASMYIAHG